MKSGLGAAPGGGARSGRREPVTLSPAARSAVLVIRIAPRDVGLFRFLLEARDNLALFTVLDPRAALLKLLFSPHQRDEVRATLADMVTLLPLRVEEWSALSAPSAPSAWNKPPADKSAGITAMPRGGRGRDIESP